MGEPTIIVAGFARCGSSLTMQMLAAGGVRCTGIYPAYEDERVGVDFDARVFADCAGSAIKLLEPERPEVEVPPGDYRCIWLDRDVEEQAKSYAKFIGATAGMRISRVDRRRIQAGLGRSRPVAMGLVRRLGPTLALTFESLLADTAWCAARIADHVGRDLDTAAMVRARVARGPRCLVGFLEVSQLLEVRHA